MKFADRLVRHIASIPALLLALALAPAAWAQAEETDPPGRVGRLSELTGQVWLFTPDSGEWVAATRNRPLTAGDRLSTDAGARAEVRVGSTTLRLDSGSELEVLRLDDDRMSLQLHNGSVAARLRNREAAGEFDLQTGEGRFTVQRAGRYRFDRIDAASHLTVYNGQALYEGPRSALTVNSGQRAEFWIDSADTAQYSITDPLRDAFASWNNERDRSDDRSVSARYVSPEMTGVEDLDRHGRWEQSPDYGPLWFPRGVAAGWAPYSTGHWVWVRPWGWTWVDDAPWGFAPFHYGRWVWYRSAWCWAPGTYVARPVYAPALVAWVGGPSLSVSLSIGGGFAGPAVGWFPLAPREVYVPSYRYSPRYVREINVTQVTNVTNITNVINVPVGQRDFSNRKFHHAVTVVPSSVMTGRQPVGPVAAQLRDVPAVRDLVQEPGRHSAMLAPPVVGPVVAPATNVRNSDPGERRGPRPGLADGNRRDAPGTAREGRPGQRDGDAERGDRGDRVAPPSAANRPQVPAAPATNAPVNGAPANGAPVAVARPSQVVPAPVAAPVGAPVAVPAAPVAPGRPAVAPSPQVSARPAPAPRVAVPEPSAKAVAPEPMPQGRGTPRQGPTQDARQGGAVGPVQGQPRVVQAERPMPERRNHAVPPAAAPADAAPRVRNERQAREDNGDRRPQRERGQAN
jgi:hypothetical protein